MIKSFKNIENQSDSLNQTKQSQIQYIGPRAIFDPNFIPSKVIPREKPLQMIKGILQDAINEKYATNLCVYGLKGVGKNLLINLFFDDLRNQITKQKLHSLPIIFQIDCHQKDVGQVLFNIIMQLDNSLHHRLKLDKISQLNTIQLWNLCKMLISKIIIPIIFYFKNPEELGDQFLNKLYAFAKDSKWIYVITTLNSFTTHSSAFNHEEVDHRILLEPYSPSELYQISTDRGTMAFPILCQPEVFELLVDYICEFDIKLPGACISYLKELFPRIQRNNPLSAEDLRNVSQYYFKGYSLDALSIADFISNTTFEERVFLDYVINYFQHAENFYIPFEEIKKVYLMTGKELGFKPVTREFNETIKKIIQAEIIRPSVFEKSQFLDGSNGVYPRRYYLTFPLEEINDILKVSFGDWE